MLRLELALSLQRDNSSLLLILECLVSPRKFYPLWNCSSVHHICSVSKPKIPAATLIRISRLSAASFTVLVYDYLLTFEDERKLIWMAPWTFTKALFLITRYLPFIDLSIPISLPLLRVASAEACSSAITATVWLYIMGFLTAEVILLIRTWAVWGRSRPVIVILGAWAILNLSAACIVTEFSLKGTKFASHSGSCLFLSTDIPIRFVWVVLMVYEAGIVVLLSIKGFQLYGDLAGSALYNALFRNGTVFCIIIFILSVANVISITILPRESSALFVGVERVAHAILTERLLLNLRKAANNPEPDEDERLETFRINDRLGAIGTADTENSLNSRE